MLLCLVCFFSSFLKTWIFSGEGTEMRLQLWNTEDVDQKARLSCWE